MAHEYVSWAYQLELKGLLNFTLVALCDRANQEGYCWPSQDDLAAMTGQSRRAISNQLQELTRMGYLQIEERRRKDGYRASNGYWIMMAQIDMLARYGSREETSHENTAHETGPENGDSSCEKISREESSCEPEDISHVKQLHTIEEPSEEPSGKKINKKNLAELFERFWQAYPKQVAKPKAWEAFREAVAAGVDPETLIAAARAADEIASEQQIDRQYIPKPAKFLNERRWEDGEIKARLRDGDPANTAPQPLDMSGYSEAMKAIFRDVGEAVFRAWFKNCVIEGDCLRCPPGYTQKYIREHYWKMLRQRHGIEWITPHREPVEA